MTDKWLAEDKFNHLAGSFFVTYLFTWICSGIVPGVILALAGGLLVELYQEYKKVDSFSWKDVIADVIGIAIAVVSITRG